MEPAKFDSITSILDNYNIFFSDQIVRYAQVVRPTFRSLGVLERIPLVRRLKLNRIKKARRKYRNNPENWGFVPSNMIIVVDENTIIIHPKYAPNILSYKLQYVSCTNRGENEN